MTRTNLGGTSKPFALTAVGVNPTARVLALAALRTCRQRCVDAIITIMLRGFIK